MNRSYSLFTLVIVLASMLSVGGVITQEQGSQSPQSAIGTARRYKVICPFSIRPLCGLVMGAHSRSGREKFPIRSGIHPHDSWSGAV